MTASKDEILLIISLHLEFTSVKCLRISGPLRQLLEVSFRWRSQEYLLRKFFANYYEIIYDTVYFLVEFHGFTTFF